MIEAAGSGSTADVDETGPRTLLLLEDQEDHAELVMEALGEALPGLQICWSRHHACMATSPDVLLLSLSTDPELVRPQVERHVMGDRSRPLVVLDSAFDRWSERDLAGLRLAGRLSKRQGRDFLRHLPAVIRAVWSDAQRAAKARAAVPAVACAAAPPVPVPAPAPAPVRVVPIETRAPAAARPAVPATPVAASAAGGLELAIPVDTPPGGVVIPASALARVAAPGTNTGASPPTATPVPELAMEVPRPPRREALSTLPPSSGPFGPAPQAAPRETSVPLTPPAPAPQVPAPAPVPAEPVARAAAPVAMPSARPATECPAVDTDDRCTAMVAGLLTGTLDGLLSNLAPLAELIRCRFPQDGAVARYAASLDQEVARARAVARRLSVVAGPENTSAPRRIESGPFIALRVPAWRMLAPQGIAVEVVAAPGPTPEIEVVADVVGKALDDIVASLLADAAAPDRLRVEAATALADAEYCRHFPGLRPGRYARITATLVGAAASARRAEPPRGRKLERALAAVKAHGGYLQVARSASGRLVEAAVFFPGAAARRAAVMPAVEARRSEVLVVDDDPAVRHVAMEMLETAGYATAEATSGEDALDLYAAGRRYDLVLLDLTMTGIDGRETYEALRRIDPQVPVILVSGSVTSPALKNLLDQGLLGFLPKPFGIRQLLAAVDGAMCRGTAN